MAGIEFEPRRKGAWQAAESDLRVEDLGRRRLDEADLDGLRQEPPELRRTDEGRLRARGLHKRQVADELERVAEAVIVEHEHAPRLRRRPGPWREARPESLGDGPPSHPGAPRSSPSRARNRRASAGGNPCCRSPRSCRAPPPARRRPSPWRSGRDFGARRPVRRARLHSRGGPRRPARRRQAPPPSDRASSAHCRDCDRGLRMGGLELERALGRDERVFEPAELAQGSGATAPCVRVGRSERGRRSKADRLK